LLAIFKKLVSCTSSKLEKSLESLDVDGFFSSWTRGSISVIYFLAELMFSLFLAILCVLLFHKRGIFQNSTQNTNIQDMSIIMVRESKFSIFIYFHEKYHQINDKISRKNSATVFIMFSIKIRLLLDEVYIHHTLKSMYFFLKTFFLYLSSYYKAIRLTFSFLKTMN